MLTIDGMQYNAIGIAIMCIVLAAMNAGRHVWLPGPVGNIIYVQLATPLLAWAFRFDMEWWVLWPLCMLTAAGTIALVGPVQGIMQALGQRRTYRSRVRRTIEAELEPVGGDR